MPERVLYNRSGMAGPAIGRERRPVHPAATGAAEEGSMLRGCVSAAIAAGLLVVAQAAGETRPRQTLVATTCRMNECTRTYLLSEGRRHDGTIAARVRYETYPNPDYPNPPPWTPVPPREANVVISCAARGGFVATEDPAAKRLVDRVAEPNPSAAHYSCEADRLWMTVCRKPGDWAVC